MKTCSRHLTAAARLESIIRETILDPSDTFQKPDSPRSRVRVRRDLEPAPGNGRSGVLMSVQETSYPHLLAVGKEWIPRECWLLGPACYPHMGPCCFYQLRPQTLPPLVPIHHKCRAYNTQESQAYPNSSMHIEAAQQLVDYTQPKIPSQAVFCPNETSTNRVVMCPEYMSSQNQLKVNIRMSQRESSNNKVIAAQLNCVL